MSTLHTCWRLCAALAAAAAAAAVPAAAQTQPQTRAPQTQAPKATAPLAYVNLGLGSLVPVTDGNDGVGFGSVLARVGTGLSRTGTGRYLAVEGEAGFGFGEETVVTSPVFFTQSQQALSADGMFGAFAVARAPFAGERGHAFLRLGYASHSYGLEGSTTVEPNSDGVPTGTQARERDFSLSGFALGFGAEGFWGAKRRNGVRLDFLVLGDEGGVPVDTGLVFDGSAYLSLAYVGRF